MASVVDSIWAHGAENAMIEVAWGGSQRKYDNKTIIMENGDIIVLKDGTKIEQISIESFIRKPRESMRILAK